MESKVKCSVCGKEFPASEVLKDSKGNVLCKECDAKLKQKKRKITWLIAIVALLALVAGIALYLQKSPIKGNDQSLTIETPNVEVQEIPTFELGSATPVAPSEVGQTIDNIESFKQIMERNIAEAKTNNCTNIVIPSIYTLFSFNSAILSEQSRNLIIEFIQAYKQTNQQAIIQVNGYTCNIGPNYANNYLSKERANAVKDFIVSNGIAEEKVETNWFGKTMNNSFNYEKNSEYRRVIIGIK